jgi:hypothetical protein
MLGAQSLAFASRQWPDALVAQSLLGGYACLAVTVIVAQSRFFRAVVYVITRMVREVCADFFGTNAIAAVAGSLSW